MDAIPPAHTKARIRKLELRNFKSFESVEVSFEKIAVIVGANASGKSNLLEALRFLYALSLNYTLAEIVDGKRDHDGTMGWRGIRGGRNELFYATSESLTIAAVIDTIAYDELTYELEISIENGELVVMRETLGHASDNPPFLLASAETGELRVTARFAGEDAPVASRHARRHMPVISQSFNARYNLLLAGPYRMLAGIVMDTFDSIRFYDFSPKMLREPSLPVSSELGLTGAHFPQSLRKLAESDARDSVMALLSRLVPAEIEDLKFETGPDGRLHLFLKEKGRDPLSAYSMSDGTLNLLAIVTAVHQQGAFIVVFEDIETGFHPIKIAILMEFLHERGTTSPVQIILTTHSPVLLHYLESASSRVRVVYRGENGASCVGPAAKWPHIARMLDSGDIAAHLASGWLEGVGPATWSSEGRHSNG